MHVKCDCDLRDEVDKNHWIVNLEPLNISPFQHAARQCMAQPGKVAGTEVYDSASYAAQHMLQHLHLFLDVNASIENKGDYYSEDGHIHDAHRIDNLEFDEDNYERLNFDKFYQQSSVSDYIFNSYFVAVTLE